MRHGWEFAISLFALLLKAHFKERLYAICSLIWANRERIALVALYKRATKENRSCCSLKRVTRVIRLWFEQIIFFLLDSFSLLFPFLCPRANHSHLSSLSCSFLKSNESNGSDSLSSLFTKEWLWANCSSHSLQKSNREQFVPIALKKEQNSASLVFLEWIALSLFRSQKTSDSLEKAMSELPTLLWGQGISALSIVKL